MVQKRRILVVIFAIIMSIMPQGVYWHLSEELDDLVGIPYYLFGISRQMSIETINGIISFDTGEMVAGKLVHMKVLSYLYLFLMILLLAELVWQWIKKTELKLLMGGTVFAAFGVSVVKTICSLAYVKRYFPEVGSWTWMQGISVIQLAITGAFLAIIIGYKSERPDDAELIWKNIGYLWLLGMSTYGNCFRLLATYETEEAGNFWGGMSAIFTPALQFPAGMELAVIYVIFTILMLVLLIVVFQMRHERIRKWMGRLEKLLENVTAVYISWIIGVCLFFPQMREPGWYFMPGVCYCILLSWGCWKLVDVTGSKAHEE